MRPRLLVTGSLALIAVGVIWALSAYERVPSREWVGPSGEARRNPYLAAERFALRMGVRADHLRSLPELDRLKSNGVLLLPNRRQALDPRRIRALVSWVDTGGHLIAEAELIGVPDPLFDYLGVQRSSATRSSKPTPMPVELPDGRKLAVSLFDTVWLQAAEPEAQLRVGGPDGAKLIAYRRGAGMVTVASGLNFARNSLIATGDNAEFLWHLFGLTAAAELQIYLRPERLSLWNFLKENAAPVLAAGVALLLLWLWRIGPRFGPVRPDAIPARRRLLDHLRASGRYYWAKDLRAGLVVAARDAALRRVARVQPDFALAPAAERVSRLSSLLSLTKEEAERFINAGGHVRGAEFIRVMHTAQRVHSALDKGKR
jgi:Domain of unknown function (DUF4350)